MSVRPSLNKKNLRIIETADNINAAEKIHLLCILIGSKWITDIAIDRPEKIPDIETALTRIGLAHACSQLQYTKGVVKWLQVAATPAILQYVTENRDTLTILEAGVLYGYPVSHVLGYNNLLQAYSPKRKDIAQFYFTGVYSLLHYNDELSWARKQWRTIERISPSIAREAAIFYKQEQAKFKSE